MLYLNQIEANFRMLRSPSPVHIQIGHGESDKGGSVSNQHKAYDLTRWGRRRRDRLDRALRGFDATERTLRVGRPQLDYSYTGASAWPRDSGLRVWYAPTWEGDRPSIAYGSMASHGVAIIEACWLTRRSASSTDRTRASDMPPASIARPIGLSGACSPRPAVDTLLIVGLTAGSGTSPMPVSPISQRLPMTGCRPPSRW